MTDKIAHVKANTDAPPIAADTALEPYTFGSFTFTSIGLIVKGTPEMEEWSAVGQMLAVQVRGLQWMVGDWLLCGERLYGELAAQAIDARHWSAETVRVYRWVAEKVALERRREDLTFTHHVAVAELNPQQQKKWLKQAAAGDESGPWPVSRLKAAIKAEGLDTEPAKWYLLVVTQNERELFALQRRLESEGFQCRATRQLPHKGKD